MNCNGELNLSQLKLKFQWWRLGLIWGLKIIIGISNIGYTKENKDEYYIKYEVNSSTIYYWRQAKCDNKHRKTITIRALLLTLALNGKL